MIPSPFDMFTTKDAAEAANAAVLHALPLVPVILPSEVPGFLKEVGGIGNYTVVEMRPDEGLAKVLKLTQYMASQGGFQSFTIMALTTKKCAKLERAVVRGSEIVGFPCWIWRSSERLFVAVDPVSASQLK
jgi:hypothetical protein